MHNAVETGEQIDPAPCRSLHLAAGSCISPAVLGVYGLRVSDRSEEPRVQSMPVQAQQAAKRAVMLLDRPSDAVEVFEAVFLNPLPRGAPFDAFWRVSVPLPQQPASLSEDSPHWRCALT